LTDRKCLTLQIVASTVIPMGETSLIVREPKTPEQLLDLCRDIAKDVRMGMGPEQVLETYGLTRLELRKVLRTIEGKRAGLLERSATFDLAEEMRLLTVELPAAATAAQPLRRTVTDHDMLAYLIARAAPLAKKHALRHA